MKQLHRHCLALDLQNDPELIGTYEAYHKEVWPEVLDSLRDSGIAHMEIYRVAARLFMILEVEPGFSFEQKARMDAENPRVREWETLMWKYQQALPTAKPGEKWMPMEKIFEFPVSR